ncbi:putative polygalacturonase isoform X4 [Wolffia australiana]
MAREDVPDLSAMPEGGAAAPSARAERMLIFGKVSSYKATIAVLWILALASLFVWYRIPEDGFRIFRQAPRQDEAGAVLNLMDFGAVGDGVTLNTEAFEKAVAAIKAKGGGKVLVPAGKWLTGPFNLTSNLTLFLARGAEILGTDEEKLWTLMPALPSYGYGRERRGPRYGSLIHGQHLENVVITGENGTINGQGRSWWKKHLLHQLNHTRGPLVQLMWSRNVLISNITLRDSPFWTIHPYSCKNVTISGVTILAPVVQAPNTDGIDPDSSEDVVIENCYICVGDDAVAIKSGWDQYGISYGRPSSNILIRNLIVRSNVSAGISIGSEMSGGVANVTVENVTVWSSRRGLRIKTAAGRGGYVRNVTFRRVTLEDIRVGIVIRTDYNEHPDGDFNRTAFPDLRNITYEGITGRRVKNPVMLLGTKEMPLKGVIFKDVEIGLLRPKNRSKDEDFACAFVEGRAVGVVSPKPCADLLRVDEPKSKK